MLPLSGALNVRDLGGYSTNDGRQTRWRKLIRAGELANLTTEDQHRLLDSDISCIVDLRSEAEIKLAPDRVPVGIDYVKLPLFNNDETESTETTTQLNEAYAANARNGYRRMLYAYRRLIVNEQPQYAYRVFFESLLANGEEKTILFHCSAGKDRTGMCAALFLGALGVSDQQIRDDYLLTNRYCQPRVSRRVAAAKQAGMNQNFIQSIISLSTVSIDYLDQAMTIINYEFGGITAYLQDGVGLRADQIQRLKQIYLV